MTTTSSSKSKSLFFFILYYSVVMLGFFISYSQSHNKLPIEEIYALDEPGPLLEPNIQRSSLSSLFQSTSFPWSKLEIVKVFMSNGAVPFDNPDISQFVTKFNSLLDKLTNLLLPNVENVEIKYSTKVINFAPLKSAVFDKSISSYILDAEDITSSFLSSKWDLEPTYFSFNTNMVQVENIFLFIYFSELEHPLLIRDSNSQLTNTVVVPSLGGVYIINQNQNQNQNNSSDSAPSAPSSIPQIPILLGQLRTLLQLQESFHSKEPENFLTKKILDSLSSTKEILKNMCQLVNQVENLLVEKKHIKLVSSSLQEYRKSMDLYSQYLTTKANAKDPKLLSQSLDSAISSLNLAQACWFDPNMVGFIHLPFLQQLAIYLPIFIPISTALISGLFSFLQGTSTVGPYIAKYKVFSKTKNGKILYIASLGAIIFYLWTFHRNSIATIFEMDEWKIDSQNTNL